MHAAHHGVAVAPRVVDFPAAVHRSSSDVNYKYDVTLNSSVFLMHRFRHAFELTVYIMGRRPVCREYS